MNRQLPLSQDWIEPFVSVVAILLIARKLISYKKRSIKSFVENFWPAKRSIKPFINYVKINLSWQRINIDSMRTCNGRGHRSSECKSTPVGHYGTWRKAPNYIHTSKFPKKQKAFKPKYQPAKVIAKTRPSKVLKNKKKIQKFVRWTMLVSLGEVY